MLRRFELKLAMLLVAWVSPAWADVEVVRPHPAPPPAPPVPLPTPPAFNPTVVFSATAFVATLLIAVYLFRRDRK